jgi:transposase
VIRIGGSPTLRPKIATLRRTVTAGNDSPISTGGSPEFRARAVELARASAPRPSQVARDLGIEPNTLRRWLRPAEVDAGRLQWTTTDEQAESVRLRREVALLREERAILQRPVLAVYSIRRDLGAA